MDERLCDLGISLCPGIGPKRYQDMLMHFGSVTDAWNADDRALISLLGPVSGKTFCTFRSSFSSDAYLAKLRSLDIDFVSLHDEYYPLSLREIDAAPIILYTRGEKKLLKDSDRFIGVVGTRKVTSYGRQVTISLTTELASSGFIIVSGMALGVDAIAHSIAITENAKTIAVLGSGVDVCHPESNRAVYTNILASGGLIISTYKPQTPPAQGTFPARNRIIAGICRGVVVTEGAEDSGSLITAEYALDFGKKVYAVPGPITSSLSAGPNRLLKKGAIFVTQGKDILDDLGVFRQKTTRLKKIQGESEEEQKIIDLLQAETLLYDEIVKRTGFDSSKTGTILSLMEVKGMIKAVGAGIYSLAT